MFRAACAGLYLLLWVGYTFYSADLDRPLLPYGGVSAAFVATSAALGFAVGKWWAPLVVLAYLPTLAIPSAYGGGQPNYSNGLYVALLFVPAASALIGLGVLARKLSTG